MANTSNILKSTFLQKTKPFFCTVLFLLFIHSLCWSQTGSTNPFEIRSESKEQESADQEEEQVSPAIEEVVPLGEPLNQETKANPFEQTGELDTEPEIEDTNPIISNGNKNPFDISTQTELQTDREKKVAVKPAKKTVRPAEKANAAVTGTDTGDTSSNSSGFIFVIIVIITVLFAVLLTLFRGYFGKVYQAFINDSQLRSAYREMGSTIIMPYIVLYGMFIINASALIFVISKKNGFSLSGNWTSWFYIFIGLLLVFIAKHIILNFLGNTFPINKEVKLYNFTIVVFNIMLGVIFVPLVLLHAYGPDNLIVVLTYLTASIVLLMYIYRSIRVLLIGGKYLSSHKFHFFMYLCTAEIAPMLLLVKFISNNMY